MVFPQELLGPLCSAAGQGEGPAPVGSGLLPPGDPCRTDGGGSQGAAQVTPRHRAGGQTLRLLRALCRCVVTRRRRKRRGTNHAVSAATDDDDGDDNDGGDVTRWYTV